MQIQTFTDEIETSYIVAFLNGNKCRFEDCKYYKTGHYTFILVQRNSLSVAQKVHDFNIEWKH